MSLRLKLLLPLLCLAVALGGYVQTVWAPAFVANAEDAYVESVDRQVESVIEGLIPLLLGRQLDIIYENLGALRNRNPQWKRVELRSASGARIYPLGTPDPEMSGGDNLRRIEKPIRYLDKNLGQIAVTLDLSATRQQLRRQTDELTVLVLAMIGIISFTMAVAIELLVRRPLFMLAEAAGKLAAEDYETPMPAARGDEVGILVSSFSSMRDALHRQRAELADEHDRLLDQVRERETAEAEVRLLNNSLELRVAERTAALEAAVKELESFSYSVSHDLRTPLRAINGYANILQEDYAGKLDAEGMRLLKAVADNSNRMGQLIDDILAFGRAGRVEIGAAEIDMETLVRDVYEDLVPASVRGRTIFELGSLPSAEGDAAMMRQVWVNLLSNALKFSRTSASPRISVSGRTEGDEVVYWVQDNGVGFDMRYVGKLFGVFQRLHRADEFEGTGIGLAIVKRIVDRHGGRVWAEGRPGEGATLGFALPRRAPFCAITPVA